MIIPQTNSSRTQGTLVAICLAFLALTAFGQDQPPGPDKAKAQPEALAPEEKGTLRVILHARRPASSELTQPEWTQERLKLCDKLTHRGEVRTAEEICEIARLSGKTYQKLVLEIEPRANFDWALRAASYFEARFGVPEPSQSEDQEKPKAQDSPTPAKVFVVDSRNPQRQIPFASMDFFSVINKDSISQTLEGILGGKTWVEVTDDEEEPETEEVPESKEATKETEKPKDPAEPSEGKTPKDDKGAPKEAKKEPKAAEKSASKEEITPPEIKQPPLLSVQVLKTKSGTVEFALGAKKVAAKNSDQFLSMVEIAAQKFDAGNLWITLEATGAIDAGHVLPLALKCAQLAPKNFVFKVPNDGRRFSQSFIFSYEDSKTQIARGIETRLAFLKKKQQGLGNWDEDKEPYGSVGAAGLALLAYSAEMHSADDGPFKDTISSALSYLILRQKKTGCFSSAPQHFLAEHAVSTYGMVETLGLYDDDKLKEACQQGIFFILRTRNPKTGVWHRRDTSGNVDMIATTWCVLALKSAADCGLKVPDDVLPKVLAWTKSATEKSKGLMPAIHETRPISGTVGYSDDFLGRHPMTLTVASILIRSRCGIEYIEDEALQQSVYSFLTHDDDLGGVSRSLDFEYRLFGSMLLSEIGDANWHGFKDQLVASFARSYFDALMKNGASKRKKNWPGGQAIGAICLANAFRFIESNAAK